MTAFLLIVASLLLGTGVHRREQRLAGNGHSGGEA